MKKIILSLVVIASLLSACKSEKSEKVTVKEVVKEAVKAGTVSMLNGIDTAASILNWEGTKPGGAHNGTVALKSGWVKIENGKLAQGQFILDMTTITNLDMKGSKGAGKIEGHLKNADFFDVTAHPTSKFEITKVEEVNGKLAVTGNLQIKEVTKSITFPATVSIENGITTFTSDTFSINRADFNIKYKSKSFFSLEELKDKFIDDNIAMSFVVKTAK